MEATDEENTLGAETIANLREGNRILDIECSGLKHSSHTNMNNAAGAVKQHTSQKAQRPD